MSIEQLFETGERKQDRSHFRNMVLIAKADGVVTKEEEDLLHKIGQNISLSEEQVKEIIKNPTAFEIVPPSSREERYEQIIELLQMVHIDGNIDDKEMIVLERVAVGIGFRDIDDVDIESILALIVRGEDTETIITELL
ncbi:TerB family tellurite resistance protein [Crocinitomix sp.]|nr:TerB family tellurite resistance protein [Crocinitomix sp.]